MPVGIASIIKSISDLNNKYRDPSSSPQMKVEALWAIGDKLFSLGVKKPHAVGWQIQKETKGLIKRPTIFRSHKVRQIWGSKKGLIRDVGKIKHFSNLTEALPLIDPHQDVRGRLSEKQLAELYQHACSDTLSEFKEYILKLKKQFSHGRLGQTLNRSKHLGELRFVVSNFLDLRGHLLSLLDDEKGNGRDEFRACTTDADLQGFANMCIALTTKENIRLYKKNTAQISEANNLHLKTLYDFFHTVLNKAGDKERARLRRLISPEAFAEMSDMVSSVRDESSVLDFRDRRKYSIGL